MFALTFAENGAKNRKYFIIKISKKAPRERRKKRR
jgi:hypothetical protein